MCVIALSVTFQGDWQDGQSPVNSQYGTAVCE